MKPLKILFIQLFGRRCERITQSLLSCFIIFYALHVAGIEIAVAPFILYLTAALFSAGVMWQALNSAQNAKIFMGMFMMPFDNNKMVTSYLLAFSSYTLITKSAFVLMIFFAISRWSIVQILVALLCACGGCFIAIVLYCLTARKRIAPIDAYIFYRPITAQRKIRHTGRNGKIILYLLRYITANKNYLMNTAVLWMIACFLPLLFGQFEGLNAMPLGFAILCLNTPVCILLSCDSSLEQSVRALPRQAYRFCSQYFVFIFLVNMISNSIYLVSWQLQNDGIRSIDIITAALFASQNAILSVLMEWLYPIRNWKIENDLWHHPRKYIVPVLMMLIAAFVSTYPFFIWIWLSIVMIECFILLFIVRRI